jgi:probable HAF family extracellular repeat protein
LTKNGIYGIISSNNGVEGNLKYIYCFIYCVFLYQEEVMKNEKKFLCAILVFVLIINNFACAYTNVINLGKGSARSVNDNGQIVGSATNNSGQTNACLFDPTGGGANINLGAPSNGTSIAYSINNSGQIVGSTDNGNYVAHACLFDPTGSGSNTDLKAVNGAPSPGNSGAASINNNGQIAGFSNIHYGYYRACLFDATGGGGNKSLGTLGGDSYAYSINDNSQIAGYSLDSSSYSRACLFDSSGHTKNLGTITGYDYSRAYCINNNSQVVGEGYNILPGPGNKPTHACLFDSTGSGNNIDLGVLDSYPNSTAQAINDNGQIVGVVYNTSTSRACLFDSTGGGNNIDLNTLIDSLSGWILMSARDINNNGWIVGDGTFNGQQRAFLLVVPEPATIILLTLGGLVLRKHRR